MGRFGLFWYFGAMMILYALLPLTHRLYQNQPKFFLALTVALGILSNAIFIANFFNFHIENGTIQTFRLWNWLFYFNLGGIVRRSVVKSNIFLVGLLFVTNYLFQLYLTPLMPTKFCEYFYCSLPVMLLVFFLFSYIVKLDECKIGWVYGGGRLFLPCYVFHVFAIEKTEPLFRQYIYNITPYSAPLFWVIVATTTILLSWLIMKIPYMDKVFRI